VEERGGMEGRSGRDEGKREQGMKERGGMKSFTEERREEGEIEETAEVIIEIM
jgi:hypothetical protein